MPHKPVAHRALVKVIAAPKQQGMHSPARVHLCVQGRQQKYTIQLIISGHANLLKRAALCRTGRKQVIKTAEHTNKTAQAAK
jgi:hypothetical protein